MDNGTDEDDILYGTDAPARNIPELAIATLSLINSLKEQKESRNKEEPNQVIEESYLHNHLNTYVKQNPLPTLSFEGIDLEWFNVSNPLTFEKDLNSHIVVLDFFTYCCINCLHILPDLDALEEKYKPNKSPVLVIGIHSAKFDNERLTKNVSDAIKKNRISHPVANDVHCKLWHYLGISCWPTLLVVGPGGLPLFVLMGEGNKEILFECVEESIRYFSENRPLEPKAIPLAPHLHLPSERSDLYYPGKVETFADCLVISDSGNNRIVLTNRDGEVKHTIGSGLKGCADGDYDSASFNNPQGAVFHPSGAIFVADTDNHCVRRIDLKAKMVETVAGTGLQGSDQEGGQLYTQQAISSPWDLCLAYSSDADRNEPPNLLLIAMAGSHQIWGLFLTDGHWLKKSFYQKGVVVRLAGSGLEENRNTSYPLKAGFAQPSGVALSQSPEGDVVLIADSESSSIRRLSCVDGSVKKVAGGGLDPKDLFSYGDQDGASNVARFQHPLGVAAFQHRIYVADSYNHKIKLLRKQGKSFVSETIMGGGNIGNQMDSNVCSLNEPGGLCISEDGKFLYVADTNNFCIKELNIENGKVREINLKYSEHLDNRQEIDTVDSEAHCTVFLPPKRVKVSVVLKLDLPSNVHLNLDAKNKYSIQCNGDVFPEHLEGVVESTVNIPLEVDLSNSENANVILAAKLYLCLDEGICTAQQLSRMIKFLINKNETKEEFSCDVQMKPDL